MGKVTKEQIRQWWDSLKELSEKVELDREDAEDLTEFLDDESIIYTANACWNNVSIVYYADESDKEKVKKYITWMRSDERYYYLSGDPWDV